MANEIKTRIQLKYDNYANWNTSNEETQKKHTHGDLVLKAGEIGIAKLVSDTTIPLDQQKNAPVLFKVGDGTHAFKDLPWASALAADVYAWAKAASVGYNTTSGEIEFKDAKGAIIQHFKTGYTDAEIDAKIKAVQDAIDDKDVGITEVSASGDSVVILDATTVDGVTTITGAHDKRYDSNHGKGSTIEVAPAFGESDTAKLVVPVVDDYGHVTKFNDYSLQITLPALPEDDNDAHTHSTKAKSGIKANGSGGLTGDTTFELNVALELVDNLIRLYDKSDETKTALATLDATSFIKDGVLKSVTLENSDADHPAANGPYLVFTWNIDNAIGEDTDAAADVLWVSVKDLIDVYEADETTLTLKNSEGKNTNVFKIKDKGVTEDKLADAVKTKLNTDANTEYELEGVTSNNGATLKLINKDDDKKSTSILFEEDGVVTVDYNGADRAIAIAHANQNEAAYTATDVTQTKTAAFGETVSFNIDTVSVDKKGHATAAQGTVNITLPALPEEKTYDLSVKGAGDVYNDYGSTVGLTLSHDDTPVYLQGRGAGEENEKGDIDITYDSSDSSGSLVETITFDINRVRTSKLYDDTYDAKDKTTTLIFNCGSASDVL